MRTRGGRTAAALTGAVIAAALLGAAGTGAAAAAPTAPPDSPAGPTDVAIPYLGTTTVTPSAPWRILDCAGPLAASAYVVSCSADEIGLAAPQYDPDAPLAVVPVTLDDGARSLVVDYRVSLAAPETPTLDIPAAARPVAAGALLRIPVSDLGIRCTLCIGGGTLRAVQVEPASAGVAWATATHLVFRASASFRGRAEVQLAFGDDVGSAVPGTVPVVVHAAAAAPLGAWDVFVPAGPDGTAEVDLLSLAGIPGGGSESGDVQLIACGSALIGRVACSADGTARYSGQGGPDQFGFQVGIGGQRAYGSVTIVPAGDRTGAGAGSFRPVPTAPQGDLDASVPTMFVPPAPASGASSAGSGVFAGLVDALDRVAAG